MNELTFTVPGAAAPQGSKNQFGGESSKRVKPWRSEVKAAALDAAAGQRFTGPVRASAVFTFARPAAHYGTGRNAARLKPSAPVYAASRRCGDLDKLCRALGDALADAGVIPDDSAIVAWHAVKVYGDRASTVVHLRPASEHAVLERAAETAA